MTRAPAHERTVGNRDAQRIEAGRGRERSVVQHGARTWLSPTHSDYCYFETTDHRGLFCIVGMTEGRSAEGLEPGVDPALADGTHEGAFALTRDRFMECVVTSMLPGVYPGNTAADFTYSPATGAITNTRTLSTGKVNGYEPKIGTLRVTTDGDAFRLHADGTCDMNFLGVSMTFTVDARSPVTFDARRQAIGFRPDPNPTKSHDYQIPWLTRAAFWLAGGLPGLAMEIAVPLVASGIAQGLTQQAGASMLAQNSTSSIAWAGTRRFSAPLSGAATTTIDGRLGPCLSTETTEERETRQEQQGARGLRYLNGRT